VGRAADRAGGRIPINCNLCLCWAAGNRTILKLAEVASMLYWVFFMIVLIIGARLLLRPEVRLAFRSEKDAQRRDEEQGRDGAEDGQRLPAEPRARDPEREPVTLEGALVAQLIKGGISRAQYQAAQARLAERDDERLPMSIPDEGRPA
jgi:hypothetical protein